MKSRDFFLKMAFLFLFAAGAFAVSPAEGSWKYSKSDDLSWKKIYFLP